MHSPATDRGVCLSMHQPWASLLVYGLKRIEGRSWSTDHRGRLWIAATAQEPDPQASVPSAGPLFLSPPLPCSQR